MAGRSLAVAGGLAALALTLSGCSGSVDASDVEDQISTQLEAEIGTAPDSVECPEDLPAEAGAEMTCTLEVDGESIDVMVTVTSVEDNTVNFDIAVAE